MVAWKLGWREMQARPGRALLTLLSVVIGVAAVVAVTFASQTTRRAFDDIYQSMAGRAALEVAAPLGQTVQESVLTEIEKTPGVKAATPLIQRRTVMYAGKRRVQLMALGVDSVRDKDVHFYELKSGKWFDDSGRVKGVLLSASLADSLDLKEGDRLELLTRSGRVSARIVGTYSTKGTAVTGQGAVLLMPLRLAQSWFKAPRRVDAVQIVLDEGAEESAVQSALAKALPEGTIIRRPAARSSMAEETSLSTEQGLAMARAFSLLVAVFIITNTFLISVTQRRRQLGILRAVGATRGQVARSVFGQAIFLGLAGAILGSLVGVLAAKYLVHAMGSLYETTLPTIQLSPLPFLWAILFGMGISLAGAAIPARKAANLMPVEAMRDVLPEEIGGVARWFIWLGIGLILGSSAILATSILGKIAMEHAVWASVLLLVGIVLMLPLALGPLAAAVARLLPPAMRVEARLAGGHLLTHRTRTTLTVGVVFIAISTGVGLASAVIDNVSDVRDWYEKTVIADFFLRATTPDMATGTAADLPDELDAKVRAIPNISGIDALRLIAAKVGSESVIVITRAFDDPELQEFDLVTGDPTKVRQQVAGGEVVIGSVLAERVKLKAGDKVSLQIGEETKEFPIAAVTNDYQAGGLTLYMDQDVAKKLLNVGGVDAYAIKADHQKLSEVREQLQELAKEYGLIVQSFSDIQKRIDAMMSGVVAGLWGMVVLGLLVAAFGVANTLTMSVLEQTFELGLLRVIASTRAQIRNLIFAQALIIGLLALLPGIVAGMGVAYLIHLATMPVIGHPVEFEFHPWLLASGLVGGLAIILLAAWGPAERAARVELPVAMKLR